MLTVRMPVMWVAVAVIGCSFWCGDSRSLAVPSQTAARREWSCRASVHERAGSGEFLARLEPGLQAGKDHRPSAVQVRAGVLAQLIVRDGEPAGVAERLDFP